MHMADEKLLVPGENSPRGCLQRLSQWWARVFTPPVVLVLFTLTNFVTYYDRGAIASCLDVISKDKNIAPDKELSGIRQGLIVSVFMIGYMCAAPIFASIGKIVRAKVIIMFGLSVWLTACCCTGFCHSYGALIFCRLFVGVGEASFAGFFVTILDNVCPPAKRTLWVGIFYSMIPVGTAVGMMGGGVISKIDSLSFAAWRLVFFTEAMVSVPLVLAVVTFPSRYNPNNVRGKNILQILRKVWLWVFPLEVTEGSPTGTRETSPEDHPQRHSENPPHDCAHHHASPLLATKLLLCNIDYVLVVFGYAMYVFVTGGIAAFAIPMVSHGWGTSQVSASILIGAVLAVTGLSGTIAGGGIVDRLGGSHGSKGCMKCCLVMVTVVSVSIPAGIGALFTTESLAGFGCLFTISVFFVFCVTAPVNGAILSVVQKPVRTYAVSYSVLLIHALGDVPSPIIIGKFIDFSKKDCDNYKTELECQPCNSTGCYFSDPNITENNHTYCVWDGKTCLARFKYRDGVLYVFVFFFLALPSWGIVAFRAWRGLAGREQEDVPEPSDTDNEPSSESIRTIDGDTIEKKVYDTKVINY